jgi:hypothetical protein
MSKDIIVQVSDCRKVVGRNGTLRGRGRRENIVFYIVGKDE